METIIEKILKTYTDSIIKETRINLLNELIDGINNTIWHEDYKVMAREIIQIVKKKIESEND